MMMRWEIVYKMGEVKTKILNQEKYKYKLKILISNVKKKRKMRRKKKKKIIKN